jgi:hypothetical protein
MIALTPRDAARRATRHVNSVVFSGVFPLLERGFPLFEMFSGAKEHNRTVDASCR